MPAIVVKLTRQRKRLLSRTYQKASDWRFKRNILIVLGAARGQSSKTIARIFQLAACSVCRIKRRFLDNGIQGLRDRRKLRVPLKATPQVARGLAQIVRKGPADFGRPRPSWTRALLAQQLYSRTGVRLSVTTVGRLLARIGARWNRARPIVKCPWPRDKRIERVREISQMLARLPPDEVALFVDEVDVDLNPKVGFDWMMRGEQKLIPTPGQNLKRYLAGALQRATGELLWVTGQHKDSRLFISLLRAVALKYRDFERIHLVLDNYCAHKSKATRQELERLDGKIRLQFLPPYCPEANKIELVWLHFHRNVTRNHRCRTIQELIQKAEGYLRTASASALSAYRLAA